MSGPLREVSVDRDSVCAGDDCVSHEAGLVLPAEAGIGELLRQALRVCPLPSIEGGRASWLIASLGQEQGVIGVIAQQWTAPQLLLPQTCSVAEFYGDRRPTLYFRYWCQVPPESLLQALQSGRELPPRHALAAG
jgi:hypothetical protein